MRLVVQEQGRAAPARRGRGPPAVARRHPARHGHSLYSTEHETRKADDNEPFSALAFKIMTDPYVGKLTFFRVYSGKIKTGTTVLNSTTSKKERIGRLVQMHANKREEIEDVYAGDICAVIGLKDARTGDTLCDMKTPGRARAMHFPEPVISVAIEPKTTGDQEKLGEGARQAVGGRPDVPRPHRRGNRPDHHLRHGRAAPGDHRRSHDARVQGRRQRRQAAGGLQGNVRHGPPTRRASSSSRPAAAASTATW